MSKQTSKQVRFKKQGSHTKISKRGIESFNPTHIMFNLSFITTNKRFSFLNSDFTAVYKAHLLDRMHELSKDDFTTILALPKDKGIEYIPSSKIRKNVHYDSEFDKSEFRKKCGDKYTIFRLYPNNNPIDARIIGKVKKNIFYLMFIDLDHQMYNG